MTTLAANKPRAYEGGIHRIAENIWALIAADIIYEGAAVGLVDATGHAQPLAAANRFAGFAARKADNAAGAAAAISCDVYQRGMVQLAVSGAVITDVGQPIYATDDDTFVFSPVGAAFIGFVARFVSSGIVVVSFDAANYRDPWAAYSVREALTSTKTFDAQDCGKLFWCTGDGSALTLPSIADGLSGLTLVAGGAFGAMALAVDPAAADMILGPDISGSDNKDLILTKATQRRGDFVELIAGDADGYMVVKMRGIWAREG